MDIRTRFVFALVSVALASMLALGVGMFRNVEQELRRSTLEQLTGLAEFKVGSVEGIIEGWHDRVSLVASRTQLRLSLDTWNKTRNPEALDRIRLILEDAESASPLFRRLAVIDLAGDTIVEAEPAVGLAPVDSTIAITSQPVTLSIDGPNTVFTGVAFREGSLPTVAFVAALQLGDEVVGELHATLTAGELVTLTENYEGLGDTGETMLVVRDTEGRIRALHPLRDAPPVADDPGMGRRPPDVEVRDPARGRAGYVVAAQGPAGPAGRAVSGEESRLIEGLDYRDQQVWAATRFVPEVRFGLIVKLDAAEQARPIGAFRRNTVRLAVTLAAFSILAGTFLGLRFAQPILVLSAAASKILEGDLSVRSNVKREDEVGMLARTFDAMAGELEQQMGTLTEFRRFFDVSIDMMCIASTDGFFKLVNGAFTRELGWSEDELLGRPFVSLVHPDDVDPTIEEIEKLAGGIPTISFENRFLCADGSYKRLRWNSYPEEKTGRLYAIARVQGHDAEEAS